MWIGEIYNSKIDPRFRIEIGTSMHREILFLDDAEEFARNLLQKIETFRGQPNPPNNTLHGSAQPSQPPRD